MRSQLLMGEVAEIERRSPDGLWAWVRNRADGYSGWVRRWGLVEVSAARAGAWARHATLRVAVPIAMLRARAHGGIGVGPLFLNARVIGRRRGRGARHVELPDGRQGWLAAGQVAGPGDRPPRLADRVLSLLGAPYLWGGRSPAGFDCSGFVQQVFAEQGVHLPRDAHEQFLVCRRAGQACEPSPGVLVFFGPPRGKVVHVGIAISPALLADASGTVRLGSIQPRNPLFNKELHRTIRGMFALPSGPGLTQGDGLWIQNELDTFVNTGLPCVGRSPGSFPREVEVLAF